MIKKVQIKSKKALEALGFKVNVMPPTNGDDREFTVVETNIGKDGKKVPDGQAGVKLVFQTAQPVIVIERGSCQVVDERLYKAFAAVFEKEEKLL
jgi:hypothetical protein